MKKSLEPEIKKRPSWDKAISSPDNYDSDSLEWPVKLLKVMAIVVMFVGVLGCGIVSKCLTLLMTSMSQPERSIPICVQNQSSYPIDPPLETNESYAVQYQTSESVHRVAWLWCLYFVTIVPYVFAYGRSIRICFFKSFTVPLWTTSITMFIMETLHCIGLLMLIFVILPNFDSTRGAIMMCFVCTIPSFMRLFVLRKPTTHLLTGSTTVWLASDRIIAFFTFGLQILSLVAWTVIEYYENITGYYLVPICFGLISFEWWENHIRRFSQMQLGTEQLKAEEDWENFQEQGIDRNSMEPKQNSKEDYIVRVIACATMWHDDTYEMLQLAKSIKRLDFDQGVKRIAKENYNEHDEFYKIEANIFFDNAFDYEDDKNNKSTIINRFVEQLIKVINEAAKQVLGLFKVFIEYLTMVPTTFGGKLIWRQLSGNRLIAHIKDKQLIRDRKRWSQDKIRGKPKNMGKRPRMTRKQRRNIDLNQSNWTVN